MIARSFTFFLSFYPLYPFLLILVAYCTELLSVVSNLPTEIV